MDFLSALNGQTYEEMERRLYEAVARGDIRSMLNDEVVPRAHIGAYRGLVARASVDKKPNSLPSDLGDVDKVSDPQSD